MEGGGGMEEGKRGIYNLSLSLSLSIYIYTYIYRCTVTIKMTHALRWAAMKAFLMFH